MLQTSGENERDASGSDSKLTHVQLTLNEPGKENVLIGINSRARVLTQVLNAL